MRYRASESAQIGRLLVAFEFQLLMAGQKSICVPLKVGILVLQLRKLF